MEKEAELQSISKENKLKLKVIYSYNLTKLDKSTKVRFVYVLKGRPGEKGIVENMGGEFLAPGCFILPYTKDKEMSEVFKLWKVKARRIIVLTD